jgi:hypothetical protein
MTVRFDDIYGEKRLCDLNVAASKRADPQDHALSPSEDNKVHLSL